MVFESLFRTLGLDNEGIIEKLEHLTIDGIYVDKVERVRGGGSLSLKERISEYLGLGSDSKIITNSWDLGHKIQLVLGDILKSDKSDHSWQYQEVMTSMFSLMSQWKDDKDGLIF